jgi:hypothetical protein
LALSIDPISGFALLQGLLCEFPPSRPLVLAFSLKYAVRHMQDRAIMLQNTVKDCQSNVTIIDIVETTTAINEIIEAISAGMICDTSIV